MLKVGITGGIGSGKSTVTNIFRVLGIPVFDADASAKFLMENDPVIREGLIQLFGEESFIGDKLNRPFIANIVFNDQFRLDQLNALVHPVTIAAANSWASRQNAAYVVKEAALFFEAGSAEGMDLIIGVYAPQHIRIHRVMKRDQVSREEVLVRMKKQISEEIKMRLCDHVLWNDESRLLLPQVIALHEQLLEIASKKNN